MFPNLKELHICDNHISIFGEEEESVKGFQNLVMLNLDGNSIDSWEQMRKFAKLPRYFVQLLALTPKIGKDSINWEQIECYPIL